jgi:shikimate kinase
MLILFGFQGCGKTYFGKRLSEVLGWHFLDIDYLIEQKIGISCRQCRLERGEEAFRLEERRVVMGLKKKENTVVSVGGGTVLNTENLNALKQLGQLVYLEVGPPILQERWTRTESFEDCYASRVKVYEAIDAERVSCENKNDEEVLWELIHLATCLR